MKLFVVLATHRREDLLERTLSSLAQCQVPDGFAGVFVVENGTRGTADAVVRSAATSLRVRYLYEAVGNKSRALNRVLEQIDDALVVFIDDDVRLAPGVLELYASAACRFGPRHVFGGPVAADYEEAPPDWLAEFLPASAKGWSPENPSNLEKTIPFLGFNWAAFSGDLRRVGGFDENFGPGAPSGSRGQESEMQGRLYADGVLSRYVPGALVHHWVPKDRCSPEFALDRAYKTAIGAGLLNREKQGPTIAGYPVMRVKRIVESWARWQAQRFRGAPRNRFAAEVAYRRQVGVIRGLRLQRRMQPEPPASSSAPG